MNRKSNSFDASANLKTDRNFRKAHEANDVWSTNSEPVDPLARSAKPNNKVSSRERYFTSQIDVLPGPSSGVHSIKVRENQQNEARETVNN